jgi:hypothetical protein
MIIENCILSYNRRSTSGGGAGSLAFTSPLLAAVRSMACENLYLKCVSGPYNKKKFPLDFNGVHSRGTFLVGKSDEADVCLPKDEYVSERNVLLRAGSMPGSVEVKDAGSTNGTKVDGQKIGAKGWTQVLVGSVLTVGKTSLQILAEE